MCSDMICLALEIILYSTARHQRPTWLDNARCKLDEAVFAAYGWPIDLRDDETLRVARLLMLNLERAGKGRRCSTSQM